MALVPDERRPTLIAKRQPGNGNAVYRFDIRLQGDNETVFFDVWPSSVIASAAKQSIQRDQQNFWIASSLRSSQ